MVHLIPAMGSLPPPPPPFSFSPSSHSDPLVGLMMCSQKGREGYARRKFRQIFKTKVLILKKKSSTGMSCMLKVIFWRYPSLPFHVFLLRRRGIVAQKRKKKGIWNIRERGGGGC